MPRYATSYLKGRINITINIDHPLAVSRFRSYINSLGFCYRRTLEVHPLRLEIELGKDSFYHVVDCK